MAPKKRRPPEIGLKAPAPIASEPVPLPPAAPTRLPVQPDVVGATSAAAHIEADDYIAKRTVQANWMQQLANKKGVQGNAIEQIRQSTERHQASFERFGFRLKEHVMWCYADEDIPEGTIGQVTGFTEDRIRVQFGSHAFNIMPAELEEVDAEVEMEARRASSDLAFWTTAIETSKNSRMMSMAPKAASEPPPATAGSQSHAQRVLEEVAALLRDYQVPTAADTILEVKASEKSTGKPDASTDKRRNSDKLYGPVATDQKTYRFRSRPAWTAALAFFWADIAAVTAMSHIAVRQIAPPLKNFSQNVMRGFNEILKFGSLEKDALFVMYNAKIAMDACFAMKFKESGDCMTVPSFSPINKTATAAKELSQINEAFDRSLTQILKVSTDKCLQAKGFVETSKSLQVIQDATSKLSAAMDCKLSWPIYCSIYRQSDDILKNVAGVKDQISLVTSSSQVKSFSDYKDSFHFMHGFPYLLVLSMMFFTQFWWLHGGGYSSKGDNCTGRRYYIVPHLTLLFLFCGISAGIVATGYMIPEWAEDTEAPFAGANCTVADLIQHVEVSYTDFHALVFKDLLQGCLLLFVAYRAALAVCICSGLYSVLVGMWSPYIERVKDSDTE